MNVKVAEDNVAVSTKDNVPDVPPVEYLASHAVLTAVAQAAPALKVVLFATEVCPYVVAVTLRDPIVNVTYVPSDVAIAVPFGLVPAD